MQQAIDILERIKLELSCGIDPNHCTVQFAQTILDQGIRRIQSLGDGWNDTKDILPEYGEECILTNGVQTYLGSLKTDSDDNYRWSISNSFGYSELNHFTHWKYIGSLPLPPIK